MTSPRPPSGRQVRLRHGEHEVVSVALAAGLRSYTVAGRPVLDGYAEHERPNGGRGQNLVPWPNRIEGGRYRFDGVDQQLALSEPAKNNAIHGLARWLEWGLVEQGDSQVTWECVVPPQPGWMTSLQVRVTHQLSDDGLTVTTSARNVGAAACPYGTGAHPYLTVGTPTVDPCSLQVPGSRWYATDERGIPTGSHPVDGTPHDRCHPQPIGTEVLDTAYGDLERDGDGRWRVRLVGPDGGGSGGGAGVTVWGDETYRWVQVFTGDTLPPDLRRQGLAVEPMTCPPNAFATGEGVLRLEPGEQHTSRWGISPS